MCPYLHKRHDGDFIDFFVSAMTALYSSQICKLCFSVTINTKPCIIRAGFFYLFGFCLAFYLGESKTCLSWEKLIWLREFNSLLVKIDMYYLIQLLRNKEEKRLNAWGKHLSSTFPGSASLHTPLVPPPVSFAVVLQDTWCFLGEWGVAQTGIGMWQFLSAATCSFHFLFFFPLPSLLYILSSVLCFNGGSSMGLSLFVGVSALAWTYPQVMATSTLNFIHSLLMFNFTLIEAEKQEASGQLFQI